MEPDAVALLRSDVAAMRGDVSKFRQDYVVLDARIDALENWRERYLSQQDQVFAKLFSKVDELSAALTDLRVQISHMGGEREAERRVTIMVVSLLSALCGGLAVNFLHFPGH